MPKGLLPLPSPSILRGYGFRLQEAKSTMVDGRHADLLLRSPSSLLVSCLALNREDPGREGDGFLRLA